MSRFKWFSNGRGRRQLPRRSRRLLRWARFERLEDRLALSASAVVEDGALLIEGDDANNQIEVSILGDAVTVILDGGAPQTFPGLGSAFNTVKIDAQGGDDTVSVEAKDVTVSPGNELELRIDGGDGMDGIHVNATNIHVSEEGAAEEEEPEDLLPEEEDEPDDLLPEEEDEVEALEAGFDLKVDGGDGNDTIDVAVHGLAVHEGGDLKAELKGDKGDDVISVSAQDVLINGKARLEVEGGAGEDALAFTAAGIAINGELEVKADAEMVTTDLEDPPATLGPDAELKVDLGEADEAAPMMPVVSGLAAGSAESDSESSDAESGVLLEFDNMAGVSGPFLGDANPIRGVPGGGRPWVLDEGKGELKADGRLKVEVKGLIIPASEGAQFGVNPAAFFRVIVSFLTVDELGNVVTHNIITDPASTRMLGDPANGDAVIEETLLLPSPAIAPIVFVTSPTGSWFAVTDGANPT